MGGSSGGSFFTPSSNIGGSGGGSLDSCEDLKIRTTIVSPNVEAINSLSVGEVLYVRLADDENSAIEIFKGEVVYGYITPSNMGRLISCLKKGAAYTAKVLELNPPMCQVLVTCSDV